VTGRVTLILLALVASACTAAPVWEQGDPPLTFDTRDDTTWAIIARGCDAWAALGLTCERGTPSSAAVAVAVVDRPDRSGWSSGEWGHYELQLSRHVLEHPNVARVAAHEIGHLLGAWGHVEHDESPEAIMQRETVDIDAPARATREDVRAVREAW